MATRDYYDDRGQPVRLLREFAKGGEGAVFEVDNTPDIVAKVYHQSPGAEKAAKLRAMVGISRPELFSWAAWPTGLLLEGRGGAVAGFLMRKLVGYKEVHQLYSPAHRKTTFSQADWRFLITAARNCAAAIETI